MATAPIEPPRQLVSALGTDPGTPARAWLDALPAVVAERLERWDLTLDRVRAPGGRTSLIVLVHQQDGTPAVLKFPAPGCPSGARHAPQDRAAREAEALAHWDGWGAVRLLKSDPESGALLLEGLRAGVSLRSLPEAKAVLEAAGTIRKLWVAPPAGHAFDTIAGRTEAAVELLRTAGPSAAAAAPLVDEAAELRCALPADAPDEALLHGAFRQGKVLSGDRAPWLAIGPRPLVGERAYDLATLVLDRLEDLAAGSGAPATIRRRIAKLADSLEVDRDRLRAWTLIRATESGLHHLTATGDRQRAELLLESATWL